MLKNNYFCKKHHKMIAKSEIAFVRSLADKRARAESGFFVAEGRKIVEELVSSDFGLRGIYCVEGAESIDRLPADICTVVSSKEMERISQLRTPTEYLAVAKIPQHRLIIDNLADKLVLALDDVQDPGNVGTIIRIADWFGIDNIICSHATADCFNPKVVQATMGALLRVKIHYCDLESTLAAIRGIGKSDSDDSLCVPVYGTFLEGDNIYNIELQQRGVIVMGNEGRGINPAVARMIDRKLYIPPYPAGVPTSESLNVATATAIICSEFRRR